MYIVQYHCTTLQTYAYMGQIFRGGKNSWIVSLLINFGGSLHWKWVMIKPKQTYPVDIWTNWSTGIQSIPSQMGYIKQKTMNKSKQDYSRTHESWFVIAHLSGLLRWNTLNASTPICPYINRVGLLWLYHYPFSG